MPIHPITSHRINLSVSPSRLKKIRSFAQEHSMLCGQDATACSNMIGFLIALQDDPDIQDYLNKHGATLLSLIRTAVKNHIS